jgi:hypothetical protein
MKRAAITAIVACVLAMIASKGMAYNFLGQRWASSTQTFYVDIPGANGVWNTAFEHAMSAWNSRTTSFEWRIVRGQYVDPCTSSGPNGVGFRDTLCDGRAWGSSTLAVSYGWPDSTNTRIVHTGIVFNRTKSWDVYSGSLRAGVADFRRTAVHEIGHSMGLDHEPATPPRAVMYPSVLSNIEVPQADDLAAIAALYGGVAPPSPSRPANDNFSDGTLISGISGSVQGSNVSSTGETNEPSGVSAGSETPYTSVWWSWTPLVDGTVVIDTNSSNFDTVMGVYTGSSVGSLTAVAADDDSGDTSSSLVSFTARANTTYRIQVRGFARATGTIRLSWNLVAVPTDVTPPSLFITSHSNGQSVSASTVTISGTATDSGLGNNGISSVTVDGTRAGNDTAVATGTASWSRTVSLVDGSNLITVVARDNSASRNVTTRTVTIVKTAASVRPSNDDFTNATSITGANSQATGSNTGSTMETGEPAGFQADTATPYTSVWWRWVSPSSGSVVLDTIGSDFDTILSVYVGSSLSSLSVIGADDDSGGLVGGPSRVAFSAPANTTYHIQVRGYGRDAGAVRLNWATTSGDLTRPSNDNFTNATSITGLTGSLTSSNTNATQESGETVPLAGDGTLSSVWWGWVAPASGTAVIDTIGSNFDTVLSVYTGSSVSLLSLTGSDDDGGGNVASRLQFAAVGGVTYKIQVTGYGGATGSITLNWAITGVPLDTTPPSLSIISHSNSQSVTTSPILLSGTATDAAVGNSGISSVTVNGVRATGDTATGNGTASWSASVLLNPGANTISVVARDNSSITNATTTVLTIHRQVDTGPPVLSGVSVSDIDTTSAVISWTTSEASDGQVEFGPSTSYGQFTALNSSLLTAHSVRLNGLTSNTTYHYRMRSGDTAGNFAQSADYTFITGFAVADLGGVSRISDGSLPFAYGYGRIRAGSGATPTGLAIFGVRQGGVLVNEAGVPGQSLISSGRIYAEVSPSGLLNTGVAIANPNSTGALITFTIRDTNGNTIRTDTTTVGANQQLVGFLNEAPFSSGNGIQGSFSFTSSVPVAMIALRGYFNERTTSEFLMTTLPVVDLAATVSSGTQVIPHFAAGGGWTTSVLLVNPTGVDQTGSLQALDALGGAQTVVIDGATGGSAAYTVKANSSRKIVVTGAAGLVYGPIRVVPTSGGPAPVPLVVFSFKDGPITVSEAGVPVTMGTAFRMYTQVTTGSQITTGIAISNATDVNGTVTFSLTSLDGGTVLGSDSRFMPAAGQVVAFLDQLIPSLAGQTVEGILRITTDLSSISVVGLRGRTNERGNFLMTTTPPTVENSPATTAERFFPHLVDGGGWTTQFILFSGTPAQSSTGTLTFVKPDGTAMQLNIN